MALAIAEFLQKPCKLSCQIFVVVLCVLEEIHFHSFSLFSTHHRRPIHCPCIEKTNSGWLRQMGAYYFVLDYKINRNVNCLVHSSCHFGCHVFAQGWVDDGPRGVPVLHLSKDYAVWIYSWGWEQVCGWRSLVLRICSTWVLCPIPQRIQLARSSEPFALATRSWRVLHSMDHYEEERLRVQHYRSVRRNDYTICCVLRLWL